jgi:hypothetical protein
LAFLDSDSAEPGKKHSDVIKAVAIGNRSWLDAGVALPKEFIISLIAKLPNLTRLLIIVPLSTKEEMKEIIDQSGKQLKEVYVVTRNGDLIVGDFVSLYVDVEQFHYYNHCL